MKTCLKCSAAKSESDFYTKANGRLRPYCKTCMRADNKAYVEAHRDEVRAVGRKWAAQNADKLTAQRRANAASNTARATKWQEANPERHAAKQREWARKNTHKRAESAVRRRRARAAWADRDLMADIYRYARIMREAGVDCAVDHIVPLQGQRVCGLHTHDNLTVLLASDNRRKGAMYEVA